MEESIQKKIDIWLNGAYSEETKAEIRRLSVENPDELTESFYKDLEFGTGGLRGVMGVGTNRMNQYTVAMATQGFANYLKRCFAGEIIRVAVAYDSRSNSSFFARITANVFSANGIYCYLFEDLRPTPELSFAVRFLNCKAGVVITASHNPKEYNGYKAYWSDGAQLVFPHDKNVMNEVRDIRSISEVKMNEIRENIFMIGQKIDQEYLQLIKGLSLNPFSVRNQKKIKIVYTPLHGAGTVLVPDALHEFGFDNIYLVEQQQKPDGNFPTVKSPNPEESSAMELALRKADDIGADLVMATDPDADRVGVAIRDNNGKLQLLNGNTTAVLLMHYLLSEWSVKNKLTGNEFIVKTIVTTELIRDISLDFNVQCDDVLTGFKYIAEKIREYEGVKTFIAGGEESYGYLIGDFVRDKDAVSACCMIAELAAHAAEKKKSIFDILIEIYLKFGYYKEALYSITKKGKAGVGEIKVMMAGYRDNPPEIINNSAVIQIKDYLLQKSYNCQSGASTQLNTPKSDVLQFFTEDGSKITIRPSGTEPKIKFYVGVKAYLKSKEDFKQVDAELSQQIERIIELMKNSNFLFY